MYKTLIVASIKALSIAVLMQNDQKTKIIFTRKLYASGMPKSTYRIQNYLSM